MVMIRSKRRILGKPIAMIYLENIPTLNYKDKMMTDKHYNRSAGYIWQIIDGPDCLLGRLMPKYLLKFGGWCNGEITALNIQTGEIYKFKDSIVAVI